MGIQNITDIKQRYPLLFKEEYLEEGCDRAKWALFDISADTAVLTNTTDKLTVWMQYKEPGMLSISTRMYPKDAIVGDLFTSFEPTTHRYGWICNEDLREEQWKLVDTLIARGAGYAYTMCMSDQREQWDIDHDDAINYFYLHAADDDPTEGVVICKGRKHIVLNKSLSMEDTEYLVALL